MRTRSPVPLSIVLAGLLAACGRVAYETGRDGGAANDSALGMDAPVSDAAPDAQRVDAGGAPDAGPLRDAGGPMDSGTAMDAGGDAGPLDAGSSLSVGLLAWYPMEDDPSDGQSDDASGAARSATCAPCPSLGPGRVGQAAYFDGTQMPLTVADDGSFDSPSGFTVAAWLWMDDGSAEVSVSALAKVYGGGEMERNSWQLEVRNGTTPRLSFTTTDGSDHTYMEPSDVFPLGEWVHVARTWDGTTKRIYVDGLAVLEQTEGVAFDGGDVLIGMDYNFHTAQFFWHGRIDEVRIYDRALDPEEVSELASM